VIRALLLACLVGCWWHPAANAQAPVSDPQRSRGAWLPSLSYSF
jgi:hypothetical protein